MTCCCLWWKAFTSQRTLPRPCWTGCTKDTKMRSRGANGKLEGLQKEEHKLRARRDRAYEDNLDGKITEERWLQLEGRWGNEAQGLSRRITVLGEETGPAVDEAHETFELLKRAPSLYLQQNHEERARLLRTLLSNCIIKNESVDPVYKKPFDLVAEGRVVNDWHRGRDSNP